MLYGKVKQKFSFIVILALSFALIGSGNLIIGVATNYFIVLIGLAIAGLGLGLMLPNLNVWLSAEVANSLRGRALGGLTTFMFMGQFLSPILTQPFNHNFGLAATYSIAGIVLAVLCILIWSGQTSLCYFVRSTAGKS